MGRRVGVLVGLSLACVAPAPPPERMPDGHEIPPSSSADGNEVQPPSSVQIPAPARETEWTLTSVGLEAQRFQTRCGWLLLTQLPVTALSADGDGILVSVYRGYAGAALARLTSSGEWSMARGWLAYSEIVGLARVGTGAILGWGRGGSAYVMPGGAAFEFSADGAQATLRGSCSDECGIGPIQRDRHGNEVELLSSRSGTTVRYAARDGSSWSLRYTSWWVGVASETPFRADAIAMDSSGNVLVAAVVEGKHVMWNRPFGADGQQSLVTLKFSMRGELLWAHERRVAGHVDAIAESPEGSIIAVGHVGPRGLMYALDAATGQHLWDAELPAPASEFHLAVSASGDLAAVHRGADDGACAAAEVIVVSSAGDLLRRMPLGPGPSACPSSVRVAGVAWIAGDLVVGGEFWEATNNPPKGFVRSERP